MADSGHDPAPRNVTVITQSGDIRIGDLNNITTQLPGGQPEQGNARQSLETLLNTDDFWQVFWPRFWLRLIKTLWGVLLVLSVLVGLVAGALTIWDHLGADDASTTSGNEPAQDRAAPSPDPQASGRPVQSH